MKKLFYIIILLAVAAPSFPGNPDRQGEAGAYELLMNPWARSAGLHTMTTSNISGVEALRLNPAGLIRINKTELVIGHTRYMVGTDINLNSFGISQRLGKSGAFGVEIMAVDFGEIPITTEALPEGTGATLSPSWFNLGISYAHMFENKVSVGITFRAVSESTSDVSAFGFAIDAGVQYVTGPDDNVKFGISLRNIGSPMTFRGEGISLQRPNPDSEGKYALTYYTRSQDFELPSVLNIGLAYDLWFKKGTDEVAFEKRKSSRLTFLANFTSNSFSQDQIGGGLEFGLHDMFFLRGGYKYEFGSNENEGVAAPIYSGPCAGATLQVPTSKNGKSTFAIDYAYRQTQIFDGTHNIAIRFNL